MNLCVLKGNLARDPEQRFTPQGTATCSFDVAVNRKWNDQNGELKEEVGFFRCEAWGKTSETICEYFKKGRPILVQGRLKQDQWNDKTTGDKRSAVKIVVDRFEFCGESKAAGSRPEAGPRGVPESPGAPEAGGHGDDAADANVPF